MKIITLILRVRFDEHDLHGALEDPVSGWHTLFTNLDDLAVRLREVQSNECVHGEGGTAALRDQDGPLVTS